MPVRQIKTNKLNAVKAYNLLGNLGGISRGQKYHLTLLLDRFRKIWYELYPENGLSSETISPDEKREITFTPEEQTAVAMGLTDMAASELWPVILPDGSRRKATASDVSHVIEVAKVLGSGILRYVVSHLESDKVDPLDTQWDEDPDPTQSEP
jgi:hypothetical protein